MTTNKTLSIQQPEDILGYIPHMLGYWPEDSLVAITMQGKLLGATLRVDLPSRHTPQALAGFADQIRSYLIADEDANGVVLAVYTDAGWADGGVVRTMIPLLEALQQSLDQVDLSVRDAWLVGTEFWRSAYCTDISCCPIPGHSVDRIKDSRLSAEMVFQGSIIGPSPRSERGTSLPAGRGALDPQMLAAEGRYADQILASWRNEPCLDAVLAVWQHVLATRGDRDPLQPDSDAELMGFLRATLNVPAWRDAVLVMAAAGIVSAKSGAAAFGLFAEDGRERPSFDPRELGVPFPEVVPDAGSSGAAGRAGDVYTYGDVLLGMRPEMPCWSRIHVLQQVLGRLCVEEESGTVAAAALTLQGWIAWCKGSGSIAHAYLTRAEKAYPGYRLAELLNDVLAQGAVCEWARHPGSAWRGREDASV